MLVFRTHSAGGIWLWNMMSERRFVQKLVIGLWMGFSFAYLLAYRGIITYNGASTSQRESTRDLKRFPIAKVGEHRMDEPRHKYEDRSVADELSEQVRVLCWVMTHPENHENAKNIKATWGKRCNVLLFMSSEEDLSLPTVKLPVIEGSNSLWGKTRAAFQYVYDYHRGDADWFMKADDDTYVIVENLRYMLANYDSTRPIHFGCRLKKGNQSYMSGGAGFVLSKKAMDMFVERALPTPSICPAEDAEAENLQMGICLENIGVQPVDTRDEQNRSRFLPEILPNHLFPMNKTQEYGKHMYYPTKAGLDCCSDFAISFHFASPTDMYVLDYLIYHLRPFGITTKS